MFATPGRDELERKKALVEADEGPFAGVRSVQALWRERRGVSGESGESRGKGDGRGGEGGEGRGRRGKRWGCFGEEERGGKEGRCAVM